MTDYELQTTGRGGISPERSNARKIYRGTDMSCWTKEELENMLEDVVNELDLSDGMIEIHGPLGTAPAELVRLVLERKDKEIELLKRGFVAI